MKTHKLISILATLAVLFSVIPTVNAERLNVSNFTPTEAEGRIGVNFFDDMLSFTYATFNNFLYSHEGDVLSPAGAWNQGGVGSNKGDERRFLAGKHCDHLSNDKFTCLTDNNQANDNYYNTVPTEFAEGDIVRFRIFFHNNGQDPYDGAGGTSPVAKDVSIGVDLNNIVDESATEYLRPLGFIKSDDNEYHRNVVQNPQTGDIISTGATILGADRQPKHIATDDMEIKLTEAGMHLKALPGHIYVNLDGGNFRQFITEPTSYTYQVEDGPDNTNTFTTHLTPNISQEGDKIWLTFDKIPGCFRYAGWVVFDAVVEKPPVPPVCVDMVLRSAINENINGRTGKELWIDPNSIAFADANDINIDAPTPEEAMLRWVGPETGTFYIRNNNGQFQETISSIVNGKKIVFADRDEHIFFVNSGFNNDALVTVSLVPSVNEPPYSEACRGEAQIPGQPNICKEMRIVDTGRTLETDADANGVTQTAREISVSNLEYASGQIPESARILWTTSDLNGKFYLRAQNGNQASLQEIVNDPLRTTTDQRTLYYVGAGEVTVKIQERGQDGWIETPCEDSLKEQVQPPVCAELKVDHPENIFEKTLSSFLGQSINDKGTMFDEGKIRYSVDPGFGSFFSENQALLPQNQSPIIFETFDASGILNIMNDLWSPDNNGWNFNFQANQSLLSFEPSQGLASALMAFVPAPQLTPDLSGVDLSGEVEPLEFDNPVDQPINDEVAVPVRESIIANPGEQVWFFGDKASNGVNVIHVDQLDKNNNVVAACTRDFPIIPFSVCESLKVNHDATIKEQKVTTFEAKSLDNQGRDFNGMITYTVDAGHGRFFLVDPGLTKNVSQRIDEGVDGPVAAPAGGFCGSEQAVEATDNEDINWQAAFDEEAISGLQEPSREAAPATVEPTDTGTTIDTVKIPSDVLLQLETTEVIDLTTNLYTGKFFDIKKINSAQNDYAGSFNYSSLENNVFNIQELINRAPQDLSVENKFTLNIQNLADRFVIGAAERVPDQSFQTLTVAPGTKVWFLAEDEGENVIHVSTECTEVGGCSRDFSIEGVPTVCKDFGMEVDPSTQLKVGENAGIRLNPTDQNGNRLPDSTKIKVTNSTGGQLIPVRNIANQQLTLGDFPATLQNTNQAGSLTLSVDPLDPTFSIDCQGEITVSEEVAPECKALNYVLKEFFSGNQVDTLEENILYEINSNVDVVGQVEAPDVVYSINQNYGAFVKIHDENPFRFIDAMAIKALADNDNLTRETLEELLGDENVDSVVTANELETLYFVTFTNTPGNSGLTNNILQIRAEEFGNIECQKSVPLEKELAEKKCIDLEIIAPDSPWEIDENDDSQLFQIRVRTSPEDYKDELFYHWEVTDGAGEWRDDDESLVAAGDTTQTLENFDEDTEVEVFATDTRSGEKISICSDSIAATVEEEKEKPKISKYVYPTNDVDEKDTLINIGETRRTPFVTYLVAFTPGDSKSVEIWEDTMSKDKIYSEGSLNGHLDLEEMSINILKENGKSYVFMRSDTYHEDKGDSSYADENFGTYDEDRKIFCDENGIGNNQLCIDNANDIDELMEKFGNGEKIKFKNLSSLKKGDQIIIKYRVHNFSVINNSSCENLDAENGCGEEFNNTVKFNSYEDNNFDKELENGRDSAKVIVICPYVITRGGGDNFFHDIIDTGSDVAKCSEVKSSEGVTVTPPREKPKRITSTGAGEGEISKDLNLTLPSHDICKYSNNGDNIEGYNDVLKNFSSTVCEVQSEVAEIWKENNINKSIAGNIERLARFGNNLSGGELNTNVDNKASGVFISESDITIDGNGDYIIEGGNGIPSAQTYIIRNADLYIKSNIKYGNTDFSNQKSVPSVAFIVIDGNIIIDNDVEQLDGIYMAVNLDGKNDDGKVTNAKTFNLDNYSETPLSIYGNLIGNVYELFATRKGYGDPTKDEGSVVVHYDSRILINTPPGITELVDVDQSLVPG